MDKLDEEVKDIIKNIQSYENEESCIIILSQEQNKALLNYINILEKDNERLNENNQAMQEEMARTWEKLDEKEFDKELESLDYRPEKLYTQGIHDTIINHKYLLQELKKRK